MKLDDRIREYGLTFAFRSSDKPCPWDGKWQHDSWTVTIRRGRKSISLPFYTGILAGEPDLPTVLDCLLSDRSLLLNSRSVEDFMAEVGEDDERKAKRNMRQIERLNEKLAHLFNDEELDALTWDTDR